MLSGSSRPLETWFISLESRWVGPWRVQTCLPAQPLSPVKGLVNLNCQKEFDYRCLG